MPFGAHISALPIYLEVRLSGPVVCFPALVDTTSFPKRLYQWAVPSAEQESSICFTAHHHFELSGFVILALLKGMQCSLTVVFIYIAQMNNETVYMLLVILMFSFVKCLFKLLAHFSIFFFFLVNIGIICL